MSRTERRRSGPLRDIPHRQDTDISWHVNSKSVIYLIHGVTGTPTEMGFVAAGLARMGWDVYVPTLPGHCRRLKNLVRTEESDWRAQVYGQLEFLRTRYDHVFAAGLSAGALLALDASTRLQLDGIGVLSPTFIYDGWNTPWSNKILPWSIRYVPRFFQKFLFHIDGPPFGIKDPILQKKVRDAYHPWASLGEWFHAWWPWDKVDEKPLAVTHGYPLFPLGTLTQIDRLMTRVRGQLNRVTAPTLILQAKDDDMTGPANAQLVYESIRSTVKSLVLLNDCYHVITVDKEKKEVVRLLHEFFESSKSQKNGPSQDTAHPQPTSPIHGFTQE